MFIQIGSKNLSTYDSQLSILVQDLIPLTYVLTCRWWTKAADVQALIFNSRTGKASLNANES